MKDYADKNILIFGGTSEGRILTETLASKGYACSVCVATEYGEQVLQQDQVLSESLLSRVEIHTGRMDKEQMLTWIREHSFACVIDATHPYAIAVTENIKQAAEECNLPYFRLLRSMDENTETDSFVYKVSDLSQAVRYLETQPGSIFLTTGSKEIQTFAEGISDKSRLYVRMLPNPRLIQQVLDAGIPVSHIFAMQGPFSVEMNLAMLKHSHASFLVSKESGKAGGYEEKLEAARRAGVTPVVLLRPEESGYSMEEMIQRIEEIPLPLLEHPENVTEHKTPRITLAGIGMGNAAGMTGEVQACIKEADLLIGAERMLKAADNSHALRYCAYKPEQILSCISEHEDKPHIVVLLSGDTGFYSGASALGQKLTQAGYSYLVLPGISSVAAFAAKLKVDWQNAALLSCHGRSCDVMHHLFTKQQVFILASGDSTVQEIAAQCIDFEMQEITMWVGNNLGYPQEQILSGKPEDFLSFTCKGNAIIYVENPAPIKFTAGIFDTELERSKVPMTKEEVRAVSVAKLALLPDSIVYDIGAGTGSVAIACGRAAVDGHVYAIEKNPDAVELLKKNRNKCKASNVTIISGTAPEALETLPVPTHAFIGGTGGNLARILEALWAKNPGIRIVLNAISLETISTIQQLVSELYEHSDPAEFVTEFVTVTVARTREVGSYHLMMGENPIWIVTLHRKGN